MNNKPKLNAAQRLNGLESAITTLDSALFETMEKVELLQQLLSALNDRQALMIELLSKGDQVTNESIDALSVEKTTQILKSKVDNLLDEGKLKSAESVSDVSFVVARIMDTNKGSVLAPRVQFAVAALSNDNQKNKFLGKKAGELVKLSEEDTRAYEIQDIYDVVMELDSGETEDEAEAGPAAPQSEDGSEESATAQ